MPNTIVRQSIGFAGLGNIGLPMACSLIRAGFSLTVYDVAEERCRRAVDEGGRLATSPEQLSSCDCVLLAVPDDKAVISLLEDSLFHVMAPGSAVIVHSTVLPSTVCDLSVTASRRGIAFLDAPISGGAERAEVGELTMMAGGEEATFNRLHPLLAALASNVIRVGDVGAGAATKLANQLMMFSTLAGAQEGLDLVTAHGVSEEDALRVIALSTGASWIASNWGFFEDVADDYDRRDVPLAFRSWSKDLADVLVAARAVDCYLPVAGLVSQLLAHRIKARRPLSTEPQAR